MASPSYILPAMIEAIFGADDAIAGQSITKLTSPLSADEVGTINVEATTRFGENVDGAGDALLLIDGEIVYATGRTATSFTGLARAQSVTMAKLHAEGTLVYDFSRNRTAVDHVRRGLFVRTARLEDLDVIGRNHGLHRCNGLSEENWRSLIQVMAYLPNQPIDAFKKVLDVFPGVGNYTIYEDLVQYPMHVFVEINSGVFAGLGLRGRFYLNGGTPLLASVTGTTVTTPNTINDVAGVYLDNPITRNGEREGQTNLFTAGSFVGNVITLGTPVAPSTPVIVDYSAFTAHYIQEDETKRYPADGDFFPYLSDASGIVNCLLSQVRAAGVRVVVTAV